MLRPYLLSAKTGSGVTQAQTWCNVKPDLMSRKYRILRSSLSVFLSLNNSSCSSISFSEYLTTRLILQVFEDFYSTKTCLRRIKGYAFLIDKLSFCNRWRTWNYKAAYEASRKRLWAKSKEEKNRNVLYCCKLSFRLHKHSSLSFLLFLSLPRDISLHQPLMKIFFTLSLVLSPLTYSTTTHTHM